MLPGALGLWSKPAASCGGSHLQDSASRDFGGIETNSRVVLRKCDTKYINKSYVAIGYPVSGDGCVLVGKPQGHSLRSNILRDFSFDSLVTL